MWIREPQFYHSVAVVFFYDFKLLTRLQKQKATGAKPKGTNKTVEFCTCEKQSATSSRFFFRRTIRLDMLNRKRRSRVVETLGKTYSILLDNSREIKFGLMHVVPSTGHSYLSHFRLHLRLLLVFIVFVASSAAIRGVFALQSPLSKADSKFGPCRIALVSL